MENSPRRSTSLTFEIPVMLGSSYPPAMNFVANENSMLTFGSKCVRSNVIPRRYRKDNAEVDSSCGKSKINATTNSSRSKKTIVDGMMGMFGSVKSFVRKLPNVIPNLNEELSVTVVSNGDIIPSRDLYVSVPLSSKENIQKNTADMDSDTSMSEDFNLDSSMTSETPKPGWKFISGIFSKPRTNLSDRKFPSADNIYRQTWTEHTKQPEEPFVDVAFEVAREESLGNNMLLLDVSIETELKALLSVPREVGIGETDVNSQDLSFLRSVPDIVSRIEVNQKEPFKIPKSILKKKTSVECQFTSRTRQISESSVESEDSFIVFEEPSGSKHCSTSGDEDSDSDDSDNDSYDKFTTDFISKFDFRPRRYSESSENSDSSIVFEDNSPSKCPDYLRCSVEEDCSSDNDATNSKVRFHPKPLIHTMIKWNYAYRAARKGPWEEMARDRERFRGRINSIGRIINPILTAEHRQSIWQIRFAIQD